MKKLFALCLLLLSCKTATPFFGGTVKSQFFYNTNGEIEVLCAKIDGWSTEEGSNCWCSPMGSQPMGPMTVKPIFLSNPVFCEPQQEQE